MKQKDDYWQKSLDSYRSGEMNQSASLQKIEKR